MIGMSSWYWYDASLYRTPVNEQVFAQWAWAFFSIPRILWWQALRASRLAACSMHSLRPVAAKRSVSSPLTEFLSVILAFVCCHGFIVSTDSFFLYFYQLIVFNLCLFAYHDCLTVCLSEHFSLWWDSDESGEGTSAIRKWKMGAIACQDGWLYVQYPRQWMQICSRGDDLFRDIQLLGGSPTWTSLKEQANNYW